MGTRLSSPQLLKQLATPTANPPAGAVLLYLKSDNKLYTKDSSGVEAAVSSGGGGVDLTTNQTVGGVKTFSAGLWDGANRAYSDSNPPETFQQTLYTGTVATPPAGQATQYTLTGKELRLKAPDGTVTTIGPYNAPVVPVAPTRYDQISPTNSPNPTSTTNVAFTFASAITLVRPSDAATTTYRIAMECDVQINTAGTCVVECLIDGTAQTMNLVAQGATGGRIPGYKEWTVALTGPGSNAVVTFRTRMAANSTAAQINSVHTRVIIQIVNWSAAPL